MKANELKQGNLVNIINRSGEIHLPTNIVYEVHEIGLGDVSLLKSGLNLWSNELFKISHYDLSPIPLTEEWLVELGFGFIEEIGSYANKNHTIKKCNDGYWFEPMCTSDSDCYIKIDFVHQVQNICFVFGEELTLSE